MKRIFSILLCFSMVLSLMACDSTPSQPEPGSTEISYKAGTYEASADGNNGPVTVEVEFSEDAIQSVVVTDHNETAGISDAPLSQIPDAIVSGQTLAVDAVSGATNTSNAIIKAVEDCVVQADGNVDTLLSSKIEHSKGMTAGTYSSKAHGHHSDVTVEVKLTNDAIESVKITEEGETHNIADVAFDVVPKRVVDTQSIGIDSVSGATYTSRAILTAVGDCIKQAGGDEALAAFSVRVPSEPLPTEEKSVDADVVVVGSGLAGISAALSAQDGGANVILLEKLPYYGGVSQTSAGAVSYAANPDAMYDYLIGRYAGIRQGDTFMNDQFPKPELIRKLADESGSTMRWLEEKGAEMVYRENLMSLPYGYKNADGTVETKIYNHSVAMFAGGGASAPDRAGIEFDKLIETFKENGGQVYLETPADSLITDASGAITGVKASGRDGKYTFNAKAVILCAGGFGASEEMIAKYAPAYIGEVNTTLSSNTGDGISMAEDIGAAVYESGFMMGGSAQTVVTDADMISPYSDAETPKTALYVSPGGFRLNSEDPETYSNSMLHVNPDSRDYYWVIINEANASAADGYMDILNENLTSDNERFFKADSLSELANAIRIPPTALAYTMNRYNELCKAGKDTDLFKKSDYLVAMEEGPWYAIKAYMQYFGTVGGVVTDEAGAVLNKQGEKIPGLYAAGENSNHGLFNLSYTGGYALADCAVFGKVAGASAAEYVAK